MVLNMYNSIADYNFGHDYPLYELSLEMEERFGDFLDTLIIW